MPVATEVNIKEKVTTKEELEDLRRRLADLRGNEAKTPSAEKRGKSYGWQDDLDGLAIFLEDLKQVIRFCVDNRVLEDQRAPFSDYLIEIEVRIDIAIAALRTIGRDDHEVYIELHNAGLTGKRLKVKLGEYWRRIKGSPLVAVLKMADTILGSLVPILTHLEPVKEFKETLECKLENDGDPGLQSLNISGREQWWKQAEKQPEKQP